MSDLKQRYLSSASALKNLRILAFCGFMGALSVILKFVATISIGPYVRIGVSEIPNLIVDFYFGPVTGAVFGGAMDIVKYLVKPEGAYFPGFTLTAVLGGLIFGTLLYKRKLSIPRLFAAELIVKAFLNVGLNSLWLRILYQKAILALLPSRILSNGVMLFVDTAIVWVILYAVDRRLGKTIRSLTKS
ncbi:MAG: folate family ECF transporter S component [Lachnospiraceae bacterium]|nr:folate family ECF transporter S component [Lachnospiraceae bacterium]